MVSNESAVFPSSGSSSDRLSRGLSDRPRRALIIGNPASVFPQELAAIWRSRGLDTGIVTRYWSGGAQLDDGTPVFAADALGSDAQRRMLAALEQRLDRWESALIRRQRRRYDRALDGGNWYEPTVTPAIVNGIAIARLVRRLRPDFVLGQEAFSFGLATAWCWGIPRVLMPWGGDIFMYCDTTTAAFTAVKHALRGVDLITTGAVASVPYIASRFGVPRERIHYSGCWRLDREMFKPALPGESDRIRARFGIPSAAFVVMNMRRFLPAWGSDVALDAFIRFARAEPSAFFVVLGGGGTESYTRQACLRLEGEGLAARFLVIEGQCSLSDCADLMKVAQVTVSLIRKRDMRSGSVLQAIACGGAPVISDQEEYRLMEADGFRAKFVSGTNPDEVFRSLQEYCHNAQERQAIVDANHSYLANHEDGEREVSDLLTRIEEIWRGYPRRRVPSGLHSRAWIDVLAERARQAND